MTPPREEDAYRPWSGSRIPLREAALAGSGMVAGRYWHRSGGDLLEDGSAIVAVAAAPRPGHGDHVAGRLRRDGETLVLDDVRVLAPARREMPAELRRAASLRPTLVQRARLIAAIRAFFAGAGFLEVETPARVVNPGLEPHLHPFPAGVDARGQPRWLATSPELHLKRLLAAGYERIFELARAFRDEEQGRLHASEFLMLEWYRSHAGLPDLATDLAALLPACAEAVGCDPRHGVARCDLTAPFEVVAFADAFRRHAAADPAGLSPAERDMAWATAVEPHLGVGQATLVVEWPADAAALARLASTSAGTRVAARMELYVAGVELANGFDELNDPEEQRRRHRADREEREAARAVAPPLDEGFLAALEAGMPPSAGMALGVDRLALVLLGKPDLADVRLFVE